MKIPRVNFSLINYSACYRGLFYRINFTDYDIKKAIADENWEHRPFQSSLSELQHEWDAVDQQTSTEMQKHYHVKRIATVIKREIWKEPIIVYNNRSSLLDGGHRLWAMSFLKINEVQVIVINKSPELTQNEKEKLWKTIAQFNGNSRQALEFLKIEIIEE